MAREIYLDLDGVCVDLNSAAIAAHGLDPQTVLSRWATNHRGEFYLHRVLGMEKDAFWEHITQLGESFWAEMQPFPWFEELYENLGKSGHVVFCSSATRAPASVSGKLRWLQDRFGYKFKEYVFTTHKDRLAHSDAYLIDDFDLNVDRFRDRGGNGILFPQIWNSNHIVNSDPVDYVLEQVNP
jgi:5'(3')-deoxyribonucleotidase